MSLPDECLWHIAMYLGQDDFVNFSKATGFTDEDFILEYITTHVSPATDYTVNISTIKDSDNAHDWYRNGRLHRENGSVAKNSYKYLPGVCPGDYEVSLVLFKYLLELYSPEDSPEDSPLAVSKIIIGGITICISLWDITLQGIPLNQQWDWNNIASNPNLMWKLIADITPEPQWELYHLNGIN